MINHTAENNNPEIQCKFGDAIKEPGISKLLKAFNIRKKKGGSVYEIFQFLLLLVFQNCNLYHFLNSKKQDMVFSKNTYYRFLNEPGYNWQRFLTLLSAKVTAYFSTLTLGWTNGYSFVPVAFNMMVSVDPGKHIMGASTGIDKHKSGYKCRQEAVCHKPDAAMAMIHNALKARIQASYILMDSWFTNEPFINHILGEGLDVIGMLKDNKRLYCYQGRMYNLKALSKLVAFSRAGNAFVSIMVTTKIRRSQCFKNPTFLPVKSSLLPLCKPGHTPQS